MEASVHLSPPLTIGIGLFTSSELNGLVKETLVQVPSLKKKISAAVDLFH